MSWAQAVARIEETSAGLARLASEGPESTEALARRAEAVAAVRCPPPEASPADLERLRAAFEQGEEARQRLRLARAATRAALAKLNGDAYLVRRLRAGTPARAQLDIRG